jgi:alpha-galactosidase
VELNGPEGDLYPLLRKKGELPEVYQRDPVRFDLMYELGAFPTESSGHVSEYVPYFRTHAQRVKSWKGTGQRGESGYYAHNWPTWRRENDLQIERILAGKEEFDTNRGTEYPAQIVESIITGNPSTVFVSTMNNGLVSNLMQDNVVEVAAQVDSKGIVPQSFGDLSEHLAPLVRRHQEVNALAVQAILTEDREAAVHALMLDPLTSAACEIRDIRKLFDEMTNAQSDYLPEFLRPPGSIRP